MHQNVSRKRLIGLAWHLHFMYFFLKKGGTLEQGAITYSANQFFSWVHVETCSRDPKEHQGTHHVKSWGGGTWVPPSAPRLLHVYSQEHVTLVV